MNNRTMFKILSVFLLAALSLLWLSACGANLPPEQKAPEEIIPFIPEEDSGELFFYGIAEKDGLYYARVSEGYWEEEEKGTFLYIPLAEELMAYFQEKDVIGAWNPQYYRTAEELATGDRENRISHGVVFTYGMEKDRMDFLVEFDPYEGFDVTTGHPIPPE